MINDFLSQTIPLWAIIPACLLTAFVAKIDAIETQKKLNQKKDTTK